MLSELLSIHRHINIQLLYLWQYLDVVTLALDLPGVNLFEISKKVHQLIQSLWNRYLGINFHCLLGEIFQFEFCDLLFECELWVHITFLSTVEWVVNINLQIRQLFQQSNLLQLGHISFDVRMSKCWCLIGLEVTKLFKKFGNLYYDPKCVFFWWMVMHNEAFNCLIVLDHWVESLFLQTLPITW